MFSRVKVSEASRSGAWSEKPGGGVEGSIAVSVERRQTMPQDMPKWGIVLMAAVMTVWVGLWVTPAVAKPALTPRFRDRGDGTVKDNLTNLIWLKDANCFGPQTWDNALDAANTLADDPAIPGLCSNTC
jgi:hypothetical protein